MKRQHFNTNQYHGAWVNFILTAMTAGEQVDANESGYPLMGYTGNETEHERPPGEYDMHHI